MMDDNALNSLLNDLLSRGKEEEWFEFKRNFVDKDDIGEYLSCLANSALLLGQQRAYLVWGIDNETRKVVGTQFSPKTEKVGNQELEQWLNLRLKPRIEFVLHEFHYNSLKKVSMIEIFPPVDTIVHFKNIAYIRVGSNKTKLLDNPEKEKRLYAILTGRNFESTFASQGLSADEVIALIDYPAYFEMSGQTLPTNKDGILDRLESDGIVKREGTNGYSITNLGAIMWAKQLDSFESLKRKAVRVVFYEGRNRATTSSMYPGNKGYASGIDGLISFIYDRIPKQEPIEHALRKEQKMFPELAIRELVVNALIHQDFGLSGTGPMIEVFADRIEIKNPGRPIVDLQRFSGCSPASRNEPRAAAMRRVRICEEVGSGLEKVVVEVEACQLPGPEVDISGDHTRVILFSYKNLSQMSKEDRVRTCYIHACLCQSNSLQMSNASLRRRLSIPVENRSVASKIISDTLETGLIKAHDPGSKSRKHAKYVPFWA